MSHLIKKRLLELAARPESPAPVVSAYLDTSGAPSRLEELRLFLKNAERERAALLPSRSAQDALSKDVERIQRFVSDLGHGEGRAPGHAVFACAEDGLWETIPCQRPFKDRLLVGRAPLVRPLATQIEGHRSVLAAWVDAREARIIEVPVDDLPHETQLSSDAATSEPPPRFHGYGDLKFQREVRERAEEHYKDVGAHLLRLMERGGYDHVVLLGQDAQVAALRRALPPRVERAVVGTAHAQKREPKGRLAGEALKIVERERAREGEEAVERVRSQSLSGNLGVYGGDAVLHALAEGRVHRLVIAKDAELPGWRCRYCDALTARRVAGGCPGCDGTLLDEVDLGDEMVKAALRQGAAVDVVARSSSLEGMGGVGALLRYAEG